MDRISRQLRMHPGELVHSESTIKITVSHWPFSNRANTYTQLAKINLLHNFNREANVSV